jgi:hypothetical protein
MPAAGRTISAVNDRCVAAINTPRPDMTRIAEGRLAIRNALNHRNGLARFLDGGGIAVDTNPVERVTDPIALSGNEALSAGSGVGSKNCAGVPFHRDLQAEPCRPAGLRDRRANPPRPRLASASHRRAPALRR